MCVYKSLFTVQRERRFLQAFINTHNGCYLSKMKCNKAVQFSTVPTREELAKHYNELHYSGFHFSTVRHPTKAKQLPFYLITESKLKKWRMKWQRHLFDFNVIAPTFKNGIEKDNEGDIQGYFYQLYINGVAKSPFCRFPKSSLGKK